MYGFYFIFVCLPVTVLNPEATQPQPRRASVVLCWGSARGLAAFSPQWPAAASYDALAVKSPAPPPDPRQTTRAEPAHSKHGSRTNQNTIFDA